MSLINQMLKDLEKRRSRDLETSESLSRNISWETRPGTKSVNWLVLSAGLLFFVLIVAVSYLLWDRTVNSSPALVENKIQPLAAKKVEKVQQDEVKTAVKQAKIENVKLPLVDKTITPIPDIEKAVNVEADTDKIDIDNSKPVSLTKTQRPLTDKQRAEVTYQKGYNLLQQGRMSQGKEYLREALTISAEHIKAREMLAGIYIRSGRFVEAAELLNQGVNIAPGYSLFSKLYARVLLEQNNPQRAIQILEQGITAPDIEPDYHALLAATYQRVNNHARAIEIYLQLVKLRPAEGVWWLGLAISLEKSAKNKEALEAYQRAEKSGNLTAGLIKFTANRVAALNEINFPDR